MALHRVVLVVVISLLNLQGSLQQTKPPSLTDIKCGDKKEFKAGDCAAAYRKINYDKDSTLDINESNVERSSESCITRINNPKFVNVPKAIIENGFDQILAKCNGYSGSATLPGFNGVQLLTSHHAGPDFRSYDDYKEFNRMICNGDFPKGRKVLKEDCMEAYRLIPTNAAGHFVSLDHHVPTSTIISVAKKCNAAIWTTDGSKIVLLKTDIDKIFGKMMQECPIWGGHFQTKGASGKNGAVIFQVWGRV
ncbi:hypothetical protein PGTUg99_023971 [Puccinia graminis f. sp. tritici]|uniref:Ecp2 effector protein domain-containing protein n=1 Tax=Puccinia graminis f. sp. tritici TaxID=56615 RepID=A0A5B0P3D2_PUCGR|nr:hypothetical protein PGTUg99_023971 [Puccinia graminis f. sp. tritici]